MSAFLFICTFGSMILENMFHSGNIYIPVTFGLLCIASNIDDFRKQAKGKQQVYVQKRITYNPEDPLGQNIDERR